VKHVIKNLASDAQMVAVSMVNVCAMLVGAVIIVQLNYAQVTVVLMAYAKTTHAAYVRMASVAKDAR
jgi:hypothetical protein